MPDSSVLTLVQRRRMALGALMTLAVVHSLVWAIILPPWQGADENLRYAALQAVAHDRWGTRLVPATVVVDMAMASARARASVAASGPVEAPSDEAVLGDRTLLYRPVQGAMPWIVDGYRESFSLSYELVAPLYALLAAPLGPWMPYLVRLVAALFSALVVFAVFRTALTIWPDRPVLALAAATVPALLPAAAAAHATVLPDAVGNALASGALALMVAIACKGATPRRVAVAAGLVVAAVLTKQTTLYLVPLGVGALPIAWVAARPERLERLRWRKRLATGTAVALVLVAVAVAAVSAREVGERSFGSVNLLQFIGPWLYLRAFAPLANLISPPLIVRSFWGGVGWFQGFFPRPVEVLLAVFGVAVWGGAAAVAIHPELRARAGLDRRRIAGVALLVLAAVSVMGQALVRDVLSMQAGIIRNAAQGRWLFAALPAFAVIAALAIGAWQRPDRDLATLGIFTGGLGTLSGVLAFGVMVPYFYVVFPDLVREHRLFFGRLVTLRRGVMVLSATRPTLLSRPVAVGSATAGWLACFVGFLAASWDCAVEAEAEAERERMAKKRSGAPAVKLPPGMTSRRSRRHRGRRSG